MAAVKSLSDLIFQMFGIRTVPRANPIVSTVGTSAIKILSENPLRTGLIIVNLSLSSLFISPTPDVSTTKGIYVSPGGGAYILKWEEDFELVSHEWYAIAGAAAQPIYVLENSLLTG